MQIKDILKSMKTENQEWNTNISEVFDTKNEGHTNSDIFDINSLFSEAIKSGASDIHIEPDEDILKIRFRIDWKLSNHKTLPITNSAPLLARIKVLGWLKIDEKRLPQDW